MQIIFLNIHVHFILWNGNCTNTYYAYIFTICKMFINIFKKEIGIAFKIPFFF